MAGYSGTPLLQKLGIKAGMKGHVVHPPANYAELLGPLPEGAAFSKTLKPGTDFIHLFATQEKVLLTALHKAVPQLSKSGMLWISWPKKASKVETDITENRIREIILGMGLVDVKVCAVDEIWSGLKIVYRLKNR